MRNWWKTQRHELGALAEELRPARHVFGLWRFAAFVCAIFLACVCGEPGWAADQNPGLPPMPEYATEQDLNAAWGSATLSSLTTNAQNGVAAAQAVLARRHLTGQGTETNLALAIEWYKKAATNGLALAQNFLGAAYEKGDGVPKDLGEATRWYRLASDQGLPAASKSLGRLSLAGSAPGLQKRDSTRYLELAAEKGDLEAAVQLAEIYYIPPWGGAADIEAALYWWQVAASKGYVPAFSRMGWFYTRWQIIENRRLDADQAEARRWFTLGVESEDAASEYGMAMLEQADPRGGEGKREMRRWLLKSAEKNYPTAFYRLGMLSEQAPQPDIPAAAEWYRRGIAVSNRLCSERLTQLILSGAVKRPADFLGHLQQASDLGDLPARVELARMYLKGEGKQRDETETPLAMVQSAAKEGSGSAMLQLSDFHRTGTLVDKDLIRAVDYLFIAARYRSNEAYERIAQLRLAAANPADSAPVTAEWRQAFLDFTSAMQASKPGPATMLGKRYLDGTYHTNIYCAVVWYSVAALRRDEAAAAEVERLAPQLSPELLREAKARGNSLFFLAKAPLPGF